MAGSAWRGGTKESERGIFQTERLLTKKRDPTGTKMYR